MYVCQSIINLLESNNIFNSPYNAPIPINKHPKISIFFTLLYLTIITFFTIKIVNKIKSTTNIIAK